MLVIYEDLKGDPITEMSKIMKFIGYEMTSKIKKCLQLDNRGSFKKRKRKEKENNAILKTMSKEKIGIDLSSLYSTMKKMLIKKLKNHC